MAYDGKAGVYFVQYLSISELEHYLLNILMIKYHRMWQLTKYVQSSAFCGVVWHVKLNYRLKS